MPVLKFSLDKQKFSMARIESNLRSFGFETATKGEVVEVSHFNNLKFLLWTWGTAILLSKVTIEEDEFKVRARMHLASKVVLAIVALVVILILTISFNEGNNIQETSQMLLIFSLLFAGLSGIILFALRSSVKAAAKGK